MNTNNRPQKRPEEAASDQNILEIRNLSVGFTTEEGKIRVLDNVSCSMPAGQTTGLVGESGCGKSVSVMTIMRLLPSPPAFVEQGEILFNGHNLLDLPINEMRTIQGKAIGMIFQEPMTSLNPTFSIGWQIGEGLRIHRGMGRREAEKESLRLLEMVGIGGGKKRLDQFPHQLSGGLRQRVMIAMALACRPQLLIADEPTTALDVTIQAQILDLLRQLQSDLGMSTLLITHDLGVVAETCQTVYVMYAGRIVEHGQCSQIFANPLHPYTQGLMASRPRINQQRKWLPTIPGTVPSPEHRGTGCHFYERCEVRRKECLKDRPGMIEIEGEHHVACWKYGR